MRKNHEASEISTLFHKACEQMYQQMKGNSVSVERLETLGAQIKELEEKLQETIGRQVTAMRDAVLEQNLELNESLAEGNITLDEIDSDIRNGLTEMILVRASTMLTMKKGLKSKPMQVWQRISGSELRVSERKKKR